MVFSIKKFLIENRLTSKARLKENDNTGAIMKTDAEQEEMDGEEMFGDEPEDTWYKDNSTDTGEFEKEPTKSDIKEPGSISNITKKQVELRNLEYKKDALLMQLKSNIIGLDQYKAAIGNIPAQIKKLRNDIDAALSTASDEEEPVI